MLGLRFKAWVAAVGIIILLIPLEGEVGAVPLNLVPDTPDIESGFIDVSYNATTDSLDAFGFALQLNQPPTTVIAGGSFSLSAAIDGSGTALGGTLSIGGTIAGLGFISGTLLTGTLSDFGAGAAGDPLEFLFNVTGGDAAALFGSTVGVILAFSGYAGSFVFDFASAPFGALADTFAISETVVPLPAAVWLMLTALGGMGLLGWRRKRIAAAA